ncbi:hypothetical protein [Pontibacter akesuensis]|uniref:Uncharacterized protein n=1 Tax=Pontibacter akesuensis TaxID=388950 RepID=A0A1I7GNK2_9BACT|nr:hypothetical protein [Pontibacter akesuensis]GHA55833.1 hypothetical protein GCM10007389_04220 [Pontibacter akesuensis]SFU50020.1 hypothetical protein SAMN04487941_1153 [Pontibacter akesuensis]
MKAFFFSLALVCSVTAVQAQGTPAEKAPASNKLERQFENLKSSSNTWQGYKVVKITTLENFWKNVQQTVAEKDNKLQNFEAEADKKLEAARADVAAQEKELQVIKQNMQQREQEIQQSMHDITHISVLGIDLPKQFYVLLTGGIIAALLIALGVMAVQHKSSKSVALEKRKAYDEIETELNEHKKNARERELKVKRDLQTELNRVEELKQQIALLKKHPQL